MSGVRIVRFEAKRDTIYLTGIMSDKKCARRTQSVGHLAECIHRKVNFFGHICSGHEEPGNSIWPGFAYAAHVGWRKLRLLNKCRHRRPLRQQQEAAIQLRPWRQVGLRDSRRLRPPQPMERRRHRPAQHAQRLDELSPVPHRLNSCLLPCFLAPRIHQPLSNHYLIRRPRHASYNPPVDEKATPMLVLRLLGRQRPTLTNNA